MKTLTLANQKGGVGKSAVATQFAYYLNQCGLRVLIIDLDHQRNTTAPLVLSGKVQATAFTASALLTTGGADIPAGNFVLVPGDDNLSGLERHADKHNDYVNHLHTFLADHADRFDCCIIDINPNPDVRYAAALVVSDYLISPIQLNQEAISGIGALLTHPRYGYHKIKSVINKKLSLLGLLPNMVEATPFQRDNFKQLAESYAKLLIELDGKNGRYAFIPKRSAIAEAQAAGQPLFDLKKTAAREAWTEIKPVFDTIIKRMALEVKNGS